MNETDRAICIELEKALEDNKEGRSFIELLYDLGVIAPDLDMNEPSEVTYKRVKEKVGAFIPKNPVEALEKIEMICKEAVRTYDNEEFYEDDCDRFLGESIMAQNVLEVIDELDAYLKSGRRHEEQ